MLDKQGVNLKIEELISRFSKEISSNVDFNNSGELDNKHVKRVKEHFEHFKTSLELRTTNDKKFILRREYLRFLFSELFEKYFLPNDSGFRKEYLKIQENDYLKEEANFKNNIKLIQAVSVFSSVLISALLFASSETFVSWSSLVYLILGVLLALFSIFGIDKFFEKQKKDIEEKILSRYEKNKSDFEYSLKNRVKEYVNKKLKVHDLVKLDDKVSLIEIVLANQHWLKDEDRLRTLKMLASNIDYSEKIEPAKLFFKYETNLRNMCYDNSRYEKEVGNKLIKDFVGEIK